jgi:uncharacterized protein YjbI with pentapeptide repeats
MAIYTDAEILNFRTKWSGKEDLINELKDILIIDPSKVGSWRETIEKRIKQANYLLTKNGFPEAEPEKEIEIWLFQSPGLLKISVPSMNLRGIIFQPNTNLDNICFTNAHMEGAWLHGANLINAHFEKTHLERAILNEANLRNCRISDANLRAAECHLTDFKGADVRYSLFEGTHMDGANLIDANFMRIQVGSLSRDDSKKIGTGDRETCLTFFKDVRFLPSWSDHLFYKIRNVDLDYVKLVQGKAITYRRKFRFNLDSLKRHLFNGWFYTYFIGVNIDNADTTMAPDLYRYIKDQQFLFNFKKSYPRIFKWWRLLSDCGNRLSWVIGWALGIVIIFAILYSLPWGAPKWVIPILPKWLFLDNNPINYTAFFSDSYVPPGLLRWLYISLEIFVTLGTRSTHIQNLLGYFLVSLESLIGFMMLGMLISVLQNRFARRS